MLKYFRNKFGNRTIVLDRYISDALCRVFPSAKTLINKQVRKAVHALADLVLSDSYDVRIMRLGKLQSTSIAGHERYDKFRKIMTRYPPGSITLGFKPLKSVKMRSRCNLFTKVNDQFKLRKEYDHLYDYSGVPYDHNPVDFWFDCEEVNRRKRAKVEKILIARKNKKKNGK